MQLELLNEQGQASSKVDAPDGLWKRMGFSNASNGAREMGEPPAVGAGAARRAVLTSWSDY